MRDVRAEGLDASRGATDFGEYFTYFSFFLVVSALLLAALFFKLGVEQRAREVGLLRAVGFTHAQACAGCSSPRRWCSPSPEAASASSARSRYGAVDDDRPSHVVGGRGRHDRAHAARDRRCRSSPARWRGIARRARVHLVDAARAGARLGAKPAGRPIAADTRDPAKPGRARVAPRRSSRSAASRARRPAPRRGQPLSWIPQAGAFFGAGRAAARRAAGARLSLAAPASAHGARRPRLVPVSRLGFRNATLSARPQRAGDGRHRVGDVHPHLGGCVPARRRGRRPSRVRHRRLRADGRDAVPLAHDPEQRRWPRAARPRRSANDVTSTPFRLLPGDDASCLNLYEPRQPRIVGVPREFIAAGRFAFQGSLDRNDEERANPWLLLHRQPDDGAVPVIADANSMTYVLHRALGDEIVINRDGRIRPLRLVAALADSILQGELLMSEANFLQAVSRAGGLSAAARRRAGRSQRARSPRRIEDRLSDFGADAVSTAERLAEFHRVENTYLSTFQTLGGLGLLLGTIGLAAVLLRNVLERRRELALLGAVGYGRGRLFTIVIAESTLLLVCGLAVGVGLRSCRRRAGRRRARRPPADRRSSWLLLAAVFATGLISSVIATRAAVHARFLEALRAE